MSPSSPQRKDDDHVAAFGPHWHESSALLGLSVTRESKSSAIDAAPAVWLSPRTVLFAIHVFVILAIVAALQWIVSWGNFAFPSQMAAVMIGLVFGSLIATQAWDLGTRWTTILRLVSGLVVVQLVYPVLAKALGGPAEQWWAALVLMMLTAHAVQSMLMRHRWSRSGSNGLVHERKWNRLGLVDLMAFSCLLAIVFQLGKFTYQYPWVVLQSFAWFGGFATMIVVSRFALAQLGITWLKFLRARQTFKMRSISDDSTNGKEGNRPKDVNGRKRVSCLLEMASILAFLVIFDVLVYQALTLQRPGSESNGALFLILVVTQLWQLFDLWIQFLLGRQHEVFVAATRGS